ncbi:aspartate/glutamate racemase family protein [candidate division KSB1 bacterium]|nr:aspartate/glutamate racemase family protein [candidate division KSB1 bacterium]
MQNHTSKKEIIGIIGGLGPYAGTDLLRKIYNQTIASKDQDHVPVIMLSMPNHIPDRSKFILEQVKTNPADSVLEQLETLEKLKVKVAGIPCVTLHAPKIYEEIIRGLKLRGSPLKLLNLVEEVVRFVEDNFSSRTKIGILSTTGSAKTNVFKSYFSNKPFQVIQPGESDQASIHDAIYNPSYGLKVKSNPVSKKAREILFRVAKKLVDKGCEIVILGCTETPLAFTEKKIGDAVLIDPNLVLARALLKCIAPEKLKPLPGK